MKFVDMPGSIKIDLTAGPSAIKMILKLMSVASSKAQSIVGPLSPTYFTVRWSNFHPSEIEASVAQKIINKETRKTIRINERDTVGVTRLTVAWPELLTFSPRPDLILIPTDRWQRLTERWLALLKNVVSEKTTDSMENCYFVILQAQQNRLFQFLNKLRQNNTVDDIEMEISFSVLVYATENKLR